MPPQLQRLPGRAGVSGGLAGGGDIDDLLGNLRRQAGGGPQMSVPLMPAGPGPSGPIGPAGPRMGTGGFNAMPFKPAPTGGMTAPGAPPPGAPAGGPLGTQVVGDPAGGGGAASSPASLAPRPAARPGYQTQTLPGALGGTDADFAGLAEDMPGAPAKPPSQVQQQFGGDRAAAEAAMKAAGGTGTLKNWLASQAGGGETPQPEIMTKPAAPGPGGVGGAVGSGSVPQGVRDAAAGAGPMATQVVDAAAGGPRSSSANAGPGGTPPARGGATASLAPKPAAKPPQVQTLPAPAPGGMQSVTGGGLRAEPLAPAPAPSQVQQQFGGDRAAAEAAMKAAGGTGTLKNWLASQAGGAAGGLSPEQAWATENMPAWAKEQGADSAAVLNFIKKNPGSPLAQKFQAAGLAG